MKRAAALQPLSRDHHHALVVAAALRGAAEDDAAAARDRFLGFWRADGSRHFRIEEEILLPAFAAHADPAAEPLVQMLLDHARIRAQAARLEHGDCELDILHRLGDELAAHVRLEERAVFPLVETTIPEPALTRLGEDLERAEARP